MPSKKKQQQQQTANIFIFFLWHTSTYPHELPFWSCSFLLTILIRKHVFVHTHMCDECVRSYVLSFVK